MLLCLFFNLGGSTKPPEPLLDLPQGLFDSLTNEDVGTIFVLFVPSLTVFHSHLQHSFIHFLNVLYVSAKYTEFICKLKLGQKIKINNGFHAWCHSANCDNAKHQRHKVEHE